MVYKTKKLLNKLNDKQFVEDIKKYIKSSHTFYETKIPELKVLAKRLHDEYTLEKFYKVFNKFWRSGYQEERSLAIQTLQLYKEEFNISTWKFLKTKLKDIKSWDKVDHVAINLIGEILLRNRIIESDILNMSKSKNIWFNRMAILSTIPLARNGEINLSMVMINMHLNSNNEYIQAATGILLKEISIEKKEFTKNFILKNSHMPITTFNIATENMPELRKLRNIKKLKSSSFNKLFFWKE